MNTRTPTECIPRCFEVPLRLMPQFMNKLNEMGDGCGNYAYDVKNLQIVYDKKSENFIVVVYLSTNGCQHQNLKEFLR